MTTAYVMATIPQVNTMTKCMYTPIQCLHIKKVTHAVLEHVRRHAVNHVHGKHEAVCLEE